ncbi:c-type cytochrome [Moritella sp. Urea-trap-13]|uniref:c-type cytochrome n=1 Tax=Moritella sp. Urea-trap-13 TaxID=2058327 RepID=UPI001E410787|nr:c-type cytochrome [Moritella sp. Urea-trap-13]
MINKQISRYVLTGLYLSIMSFSAVSADYNKLKNMCMACHGDNGVNPYQSIPDLQGQSLIYLRNQMAAFKSGERQDITMGKVVQLLSDDDIIKLTKYFSEQ